MSWLGRGRGAGGLTATTKKRGRWSDDEDDAQKEAPATSGSIRNILAAKLPATKQPAFRAPVFSSKKAVKEDSKTGGPSIGHVTHAPALQQEVLAEETRAQTQQRAAKKSRFGPAPPPSNVRQITVMDHQLAICKDYYETGYCSFGDACKFAHIREDYKSGWQLKREEEEAEKRKRMGAMEQKDGEEEQPQEAEDEEFDSNGVPYKCGICKDEFNDPVITRCSHYFCESCALEYHRSTGRCATCDRPTGGVFNTAKAVIQRNNINKAKLR